jgi:hypothetical protein
MPTNLITGMKKEDKRSTMPKNNSKIQILHLVHSRRHLKRGMPDLGRKLSKRAVKIAYHLNMCLKNGIKIEVNYLVKIDPEIRRCNKHGGKCSRTRGKTY